MPELPEITVIAEQMKKELIGKAIAEVEVKQPKNLNIPVSKFVEVTKGKKVKDVSSQGKWIFIELDPEYFILVNLRMGGDLLLFNQRQKDLEKYQFRLTFSDRTGFTILFWWFGHVHLIKELSRHKMTSGLGISPLDNEFTPENFKRMLAKKKSRIKNFLLDQKNVAGIGNVYIQDILFKAKLHPNRAISTLSNIEIDNLYNAILDTLNQSIKLGGLAYEKDFYGNKGKFNGQKFLVGFKEGNPCPVCNSVIEKIRTGSTSTYICPKCQILK